MGNGRVFFSTGTFGTAPGEAVERLMIEGIDSIELSGGKPDKGVADLVIDFGLRVNLQLHNYFPPADPPFVFNLASTLKDVRERTIDSMLSAIELSAAIGARRYSFHAGFLVDPPVTYLGTTWGTLERANPRKAQELFLDSVAVLSERARSLGVGLLVENNVLTRGTRDQGGDDVLLMASCQQICEMMDIMPEGVGLLMDVAHLKVSSNTLGFSAEKALGEVTCYVSGYHLSDNDGLTDSNGPIAQDSWFWSGLSRSVPFATLEVAPAVGLDLRAQVDLAESMWLG